MLLYCSSVPPTLQQFNPQLLLSERFSTAKKPLECTPPFPMQFLRYLTILIILPQLLYATFPKIWLSKNDAGSSRNHVQHYTNRSLHTYPLLDDRIRLDCGQILLVLLLHVNMLRLLHPIRYDACRLDTKLSNSWNLLVLLPQFLESFLRFPHP